MEDEELRVTQTEEEEESVREKDDTKCLIKFAKGGKEKWKTSSWLNMFISSAKNELRETNDKWEWVECVCV